MAIFHHRFARHHLSLLPALLAILMLLTAGCGTLGSWSKPKATIGERGFVEPLPMVAEHPGRMPARELDRALAALQRQFERTDGTEAKARLVGDTLTAFQNWLAIHPDAASADLAAVNQVITGLERTWRRLTLFSRMDSARTELDAARVNPDVIDGAMARANAHGHWVLILREAAEAGCLSPEEHALFKAQCPVHERGYLAARTDLAVERARIAWVQPVSFAETLNAHQAILSVLTEAMARSDWSFSDRSSLEDRRRDTDGKIRQLKTEHGAFKKQIDAEFDLKQRRFCSQLAGADYAHANALYRAEVGKWCNWGLTGRWRDNHGNIILAVLFCDRIVGEPQVDYPIRNQAAQLRAGANARLTGKWQAARRGTPPLLAFRNLPQYPRLEAEELEAEINRRWLKLSRQATPELAFTDQLSPVIVSIR